MRKRKIILHVGQSKAGSTSIQNYLEQQYGQLAERGVLFPKSVLSRHNVFDPERTSGHRQLLADLKVGDVAGFEEEVAARKPHTIILSIEGLFSDLPPDALRSLRDYFCDDEIELIAVLRPQMDWLRSRYVEDVMTGFKSSFTKPFSAFAHGVFDLDTLSYHARLKSLSAAFDAIKTTAIAMVKRETSLVQRFMEAAGLSVGDTELAGKIHSNRREKSPAMIEAKRRLNALTSRLETRDRLELEQALRDHAATTLADHRDADRWALNWRVPLEPAELESLRQGNLALHRDGVIDAPLPIGEHDGPRDQLSKRARGDMRRLFEYGLSKAIEIAARALDRGEERASAMSFSPAEAAAIWGVMREARVSLHVNAPATSSLAACVDGGISNLLLYPSSGTYRLIATLERLHTASPLTAAVIPSGEVSQLTRCMKRLHIAAPDLFVAGGATTARPVRLAVEQLKPRWVILLDEAIAHASELSLTCYNVDRVGRSMIMHRRKAR